LTNMLVPICHRQKCATTSLIMEKLVLIMAQRPAFHQETMHYPSIDKEEEW
jgi:hypothetical protein